VNEASGNPLNLRVDRLDALFQETAFIPARPDLDPGPALAHLLRRFDLRDVLRATTLRVHLGSDHVTAETSAVASTAIRTFCRQRALENRSAVRAIRRAGRRAMCLALALLALAMGASLALTHFEPFPEIYNDLLSEAFVVAGWVVLWRPLELLFYEWYEPWRDAKGYERLAELSLELLTDAGELDAGERRYPIGRLSGSSI
jgi:hypothetical protein